MSDTPQPAKQKFSIAEAFEKVGIAKLPPINIEEELKSSPRVQKIYEAVNGYLKQIHQARRVSKNSTLKFVACHHSRNTTTNPIKKQR